MNYKNIAKKNYLLLALTILVLNFSSCNTEDNLKEYYEGTYTDSIMILSESDTVNIVLEQPKNYFNKENIPYSFETNNNNSETITLKLFVSYGSHNQNPITIKDINKNMDTFYVWYSLRDKMNKTLFKNNYITKVNTSPKANYISVDSVAIQKGANKLIGFISRLIDK